MKLLSELFDLFPTGKNEQQNNFLNAVEIAQITDPAQILQEIYQCSVYLAMSKETNKYGNRLNKAEERAKALGISKERITQEIDAGTKAGMVNNHSQRF